MSSFTETQPSLLNDESSQSNNSVSEITVGTLIKDARQYKGLSQKDLASRCDITPVQLCRIEKDDSIPSKKTLKKLSSHTGLPYSTLLIKAGYNNMSGKKVFFKTDGTELNVEQLVCTIYKADSDLLDFFHGFEHYGSTENVKALKLFLQAMRKENELCKESSTKQEPINQYFKATFQAMKKFIISSLETIINC